MPTPHDEILQLRSQLHEHNFQYYGLNLPAISDEEYDRLLLRLKELETHWPDYDDPNSPTKRVGTAPSQGFAKVAHATPMLSLANAFSAEEVSKFFASRDFTGMTVLEPKIDGLALDIRYLDGQLVCATTRGDGATGDDVTANVRTIRSVPLVIEEHGDIHVRGEVYLRRADFDTLNRQLAEDGDELFKNPRNAAAGTLKLRDSTECAKRRLSFIAYRVLGKGGNEERGQISSHYWLSENRFTPPKTNEVTQASRSFLFTGHPETDADAITSALEAWQAARGALDYDIDGVVFKVDSRKAQRELGDGSKYVNWAVAYKFPAQRVSTKLLAITCQVGKSGAVTPVAELQPVQISGSTVARASLCNQDEINRLGVAIGDDVFVVKSGEIIPKIVGVEGSDDYRSYTLDGQGMEFLAALSPEEISANTVDFNRVASRVWQMPDACPACQTKLVRATSLDGKQLVAHCCPNPDCMEQAVQRIEHAASKGCLDWGGFGARTARLLVEQCGVRRISDLFVVPLSASSVWAQKHLSPVDAVLKAAALKQFIAGRDKAKAAPMWRKLHALGIEGIGTTLSKELSNKFPDIVAIVDAATTPCEDQDGEPKSQLAAIIGNVNAATVLDFIDKNMDEIDLLDSLGFRFESERHIGVLTGKTFVITGELNSGTRAAVTDRIEKAGGVVKSSVGKSTNFLIVGEGAGATKSEAAAKKGIAILREEGLYEMLGIPMPDPFVLPE